MAQNRRPQQRGEQAQGAQLMVRNKESLRSYLTDPRFIQQVSAVLPKHLTPERMASLTFLACTQTPKLLECSPISIVRAVMAASVTGLEFNGPLGHAYLIPFAGEAQFVPGYRGLIDLVVRGGGAAWIGAHVVYPDDEFDIVYGSRPNLHHRPNFEARADIPPGELLNEIKGAYMVAELPNKGGIKFDFMSRQDIIKRRGVSKTANRSDSPWQIWTEEMIRKTPIRHGVKELPVSADRIAQRLGAALEFDNRFEAGTITNIIPEFDDAATVEASIINATASRASDLREELERKAGAVRQRVEQEKAEAAGSPPAEPATAQPHQPVEGAPDFDGTNFDTLPQDQQDAILANERDLFGG
jgi:recombination protein RecT